MNLPFQSPRAALVHRMAGWSSYQQCLLSDAAWGVISGYTWGLVATPLDSTHVTVQLATIRAALHEGGTHAAVR